MLRVKLINEPKYSDKIKKFAKLGEPLPIIGEIYTVSGYIDLEDVTEYKHLVKRGLKTYKGYTLEEFDLRELGIILGIHQDNFEIVSDDFTPNHYIVDGPLQGPCESVKMFMNFKFDNNEG